MKPCAGEPHILNHPSDRSRQKGNAKIERKIVRRAPKPTVVTPWSTHTVFSISLFFLPFIYPPTIVSQMAPAQMLGEGGVFSDKCFVCIFFSDPPTPHK